jgi:nitroreductase
MEVSQAIKERRSIRKFKEDPVPIGLLSKILEAGTLAPSGKNKQPWKFYVVQGEKRSEMIQAMQRGMDRLSKMGISTGSAKFTLRVMETAPVTIFVFNPTSRHPLLKRDTLEVYTDIVDIQSIGAAIQNMLLTALDLGLGTLWICDVFFGYEELCEWLGEKGQMIAAVSIGYPDASPSARPRKPVEAVTEFLE